MHAEYPLIHKGADWHEGEGAPKGLPQLDAVPALTLVEEAVEPVDRRALVVPAQEEEILGVLCFVCEKQHNALDRVLAPVDIVAEEEVVRLLGAAAVLEHP